MNDDISIDTITLNLSEDDMAYIINSPANTATASWATTTGTSGVWLSANSAGSSTWTDTLSGTTIIESKALSVKGDAEFEGDIKVQGKSLSETLDNIEKRLAILHPNKELEEKWERLKALGDMYRELEAEIIEKEQIWATLKK